MNIFLPDFFLHLLNLTIYTYTLLVNKKTLNYQNFITYNCINKKARNIFNFIIFIINIAAIFIIVTNTTTLVS